MSFYAKLRKKLIPVLRLIFQSKAYDIPALPDGPLVICSNHISVIDPLFLAVYLERPLTFMAKKELFRIPLLKSLLEKIGVIPLERNGSDAAKLRLAVRQLQEGAAITIFPQGTRRHEPCENTEIKPGVSLLVSLSGATVLPVGIYAKNYRVRPLRRTVLCFGEPKQYQIPQMGSRREELCALADAIFGDIASLSEKARREAEK